jgi:hypothetical protein
MGNGFTKRLASLILTATAVFGNAGCGQLVSRPPALDYAEPSPRVDVRFEEPFELEMVRLPERDGAVVARCNARCSLRAPSGRYLLRAHGDAPGAERTIDLRHSARVMVRPGSSFGSTSGLGLIVGGAVASLALPVGALTSPLADPDDSTPAVLGVVGVTGLVALVTGLVVHRSSRTTIEVEQFDEPVTRLTLRGVSAN